MLNELMINANQLENSPESTAAHLRKTGLGYMVDPVLWRFQEPQWWRNDGGETKRNYLRLAQAYARDTSIRMAEGPLLETVPSDGEWDQLARNVVAYQRQRLAMPAQLDLLDDSAARILQPTRIVAPALLAQSQREDRINRLLVEASSTAAGSEVVAMVAVPLSRLRKQGEISDLVKTVTQEGVAAYILWTPDVTEDLLIGDHEVFSAVLSIVSILRRRGLPICHSQGSYVTAALHSAGVDGVMHHLGWVDKGEPAQETRGGLRSCQTYVPGVRHSVRFHNAVDLGRELKEDEYRARYCDCAFCVGSFEAGQHPLDLLLEEQRVPYGVKGTRLTPTGRATSANIWHYLLARRQEVEAFSRESALTVIQRDMERARQLASPRDRVRLERLAAELQTA
jgi:hypothetical protein